MYVIPVGRGQCMLVMLAGELFIDPARIVRMRSCVVRGVRAVARVAGDRIIGHRRAMRLRRDPREKELQDQRACHLAHARLGTSPISRPSRATGTSPISLLLLFIMTPFVRAK